MDGYMDVSKLPNLLLAAVGREVDQSGPFLREACQGGGLVLASPKPRKKSPELLARLETLQRQLEQQQYDRMVRDVTVAVSQGSTPYHAMVIISQRIF
jgi:hypothetical protein